MLVLIIALAMTAGLIFATLYALKREHKASLFNSLKMRNHGAFAD